MRKTFFYYIVFFFIIINPSFSQVVYIDINKVLNESVAGKKAIELLEQEIKTKNKKFAKIEKKLINEEKKIIAQKNVLSEEDYKQKIVNLRNKVKDYNLSKNTELNKLNEKKNSLTTKFMNKINPLIADYATKNNISIVIRKEHMIIGKTELDISNNVLKIVDEKITEIN